MSKNKDHSSWKAWGEYRKERSRLKDFEDWKKEYKEEMAGIFVVINEWQHAGDEGECTEIVGSQYFTSEDGAWDGLKAIADANEVTLERDQYELDVEPGARISYDTYYIQELTKNG